MKRDIAIVVAIVLVAFFSSEASAAGVTDNEVSTSFQTVSQEQRVAAKLVLVNGDQLGSQPDGAVTVGRGALGAAVAGFDQLARSMMIEFLVGHELWHQQQFKNIGAVILKDGVEQGRLRECQADMMSALWLSRRRFALADPKSQQSLLAIGTSLRQIEARVAELTKTGTSEHPYLSARKRLLSLIVAVQAAFLEFGAKNGLIPNQIQERSRRFLDRSGNRSDDLWSWAYCKRLARFSQGVIDQVQFDWTPGDTEGAGRGWNNHDTIALRNTADRSIKVSLLSYSAHHPKGKDDYLSYQFDDAALIEAELKPQETKSFRTMVWMAALQDNKAEHPLLPFDEETLVSAEFVGPKPIKPSCMQIALDSLPERAQALAGDLFGLAAAAPVDFKTLIGELETDIGTTKEYKSTSPVASAIHVTVQIDQAGGGIASADFIRTPSKKEADAKFESLAGDLSKICHVQGVVIDRGARAGTLTDITIHDFSAEASLTLMTMKLKKTRFMKTDEYLVSIFLKKKEWQ